MDVDPMDSEEVGSSKFQPDSPDVNAPVFEEVEGSDSGVKVRRLNRKRIMWIGAAVLGLVFGMMALQMFAAKESTESNKQEEEQQVSRFGKTAEQKISDAAAAAKLSGDVKPGDKEKELQAEQSEELKEALKIQNDLEEKFAAVEKEAEEEEEDENNPWKKAQERATVRRAQEYYEQGHAARGATVIAQVDIAPGSSSKQKDEQNDYESGAKQAEFLERINRINVPAPGGVRPGEGQIRQNQKLEFHENAHAQPTQNYNRLSEAVSPFVIQAGTILPLVLETGISSDLPGFVKARFASPVYDSVTGRYLLIPSGTVVTGEYNSTVSFGQERVQVAWTRMILPNGKSMELGGIPAVDLSGQSGVSDHVDNHWDKVLAAAGLSSLFSATASAAAGPTNQLNTTPQQAALGGFATDVAKTGTDVVEKQLEVPPTLSIRPGFQLAAFVREDLVLEPWGGVDGL